MPGDRRVGLVRFYFDDMFADAGPGGAPCVADILNFAVGAFNEVDGL